jgi:hypothetical protein
MIDTPYIYYYVMPICYCLSSPRSSLPSVYYFTFVHIVAAIALVLLPVYAYTCTCVFVELVAAAMLQFAVIVVNAFLYVELIVAASLLILPRCSLAVRIVAAIALPVCSCNSPDLICTSL